MRKADINQEKVHEFSLQPTKYKEQYAVKTNKSMQYRAYGDRDGARKKKLFCY
jgi:hypothetical protein